MVKTYLLTKVKNIQKAYKKGLLGDITMPEDTHPIFKSHEDKLVYYTLPMALNYQRNSFKLWEAAKMTWEDPETKNVFKLKDIQSMGLLEVRQSLLKHKLALQPNKHIDTWIRISKFIFTEWGSLSNLFEEYQNDYQLLQKIIQVKFKKSFPYLSGPKIFNYWIFIMSEYGGIKIKNRNKIEIAPDTHIIQASVKLELINSQEALKISREQLSSKWRDLLEGSGIDPIDIHSPLWFWSRSKFDYQP